MTIHFDSEPDMNVTRPVAGVLAMVTAIVLMAGGYGQIRFLRSIDLLFYDRMLSRVDLSRSCDQVVNVVIDRSSLSQSIESNLSGPAIQAGPLTIPVTIKGHAVIGERPDDPVLRHISAADVMAGTVSAAWINNKIVIAGFSDTKADAVPGRLLNRSIDDMNAKALLVSRLFDDKPIVFPRWGKHVSAAVCLCAICLMMTLLWYKPSMQVFVPGSLAILLLVTLPFYYLFVRKGLMVSPGMPLLAVVVLFTGCVLIRSFLVPRYRLAWCRQLALSQQQALEAMISTVETRDTETGSHIKRTQDYARALAVHLKANGFFPNLLTDEYINTLYLAVPLHDIGKVGIPDRILLKEGPLTDEEFELMKLHAPYGRRTIERAIQGADGQTYLKMGAEIAGFHHERWNGTGYPDGLFQTEIPLSARIMGICDVYDALISRRCYKQPFSHEKSMALIKERRGTTFDPDLVDAFVAIADQIQTIARTHKDTINVSAGQTPSAL